MLALALARPGGARPSEPSGSEPRGAAIYRHLQSQPAPLPTTAKPGPVETARVRAEREASKTNFKQLDRGEARNVLEDHQPEIATQDGWLHPPLKPGQRLELADGDSGRVVNPDGTAMVVQSTAPLGFREDGALKPIDLALEQTADGLEPKSSPVQITIPAHATDAVQVGTGDSRVGLSAEGAPAATATQTDVGVLYANVAADTDLFIKPIIGGVESFQVLRSENSPQEVSLRLHHPEGTTIKPDSVRGGYVIVDGDRVVSSISEIVAHDDTRREVPISTTLDGDVLKVHVPHQGGGYTYPIVVDPDVVQVCWTAVTNHGACQVYDWENRNDNAYGNDYTGWEFYSPPDPDNRYAGHFQGINSWLGAGMYIWDLGYYNYFRAGEWGSFYSYKASPGVKIYAALYNNLSTDNLSDNPTCSYVGLLTSNWTWFQNSPYYVGGCAQTTYEQTILACEVNCQGSAGDYGDYAIFGVVGQGRWSQRWAHNLGAVLLYLTEYDAPAVRAVYPPDPDQLIMDPNTTVTFNSGDAGTGLKRIEYYRDAQPWTPTMSNGQLVGDPCPYGTGGIRTFTCPHDYWQDIKLAGIPAGRHTIHVVVKDVEGHVGWTSPDVAVNIGFGGPYPTSDQYGGADHTINTDAETEALGSALATGAASTLWSGLTPSDKNYMMSTAEDSHYAVWASRIDTVAPTAVADIPLIDYDASTHTASFAWTEGTDPDISAGIYGSGVDELHSVYRYRRGGGAWSAYVTTDTTGFDLSSVNAGDVVAVEVTEFDRAGNGSASRVSTLIIPSAPVATIAVAFVLPVIACIEWCPVAAAGVGAITSGAAWWVNNQGHKAQRWSSNGSIKITRSTDHTPTFEESEVKSKRERGNLRKDGEVRDRKGTSGEEAHHVVAVSSKYARYARWVLYRCGLDPNKWLDNGLWLPKWFHSRMHTKSYYEAINDMLWRYDPTFGADPCGQNEGGVDLTGNGLRKAMNDIKNYILRGEMP
ncbi:MAG TPA: AHH domain-containing protein [Baekduia sp.]|nr:AHH domain-containing protein [Baekduia sp.]